MFACHAIGMLVLRLGLYRHILVYETRQLTRKVECGHQPQAEIPAGVESWGG